METDNSITVANKDGTFDELNATHHEVIDLSFSFEHESSIPSVSQTNVVTPSFDRASNAFDKIKEAIKFGSYEAFQNSKSITNSNGDSPFHSDGCREDISTLADNESDAITRNSVNIVPYSNQNSESLSISNGYIQKNPIFHDIKCKIFNPIFHNLYAESLSLNIRSPDLIQLTRIDEFPGEYDELDDDRVNYRVIFYVWNKKSLDSLYESFCSVDREKIPGIAIVVGTNEEDVSDLSDEYEITSMKLLDEDFFNVLKYYSTTAMTSIERSKTSTKITSFFPNTDAAMKENRLVLYKAQDNELNTGTVVKPPVLMSPDYPSFWDEWMNNKQKTVQETEQFFKSADWLTETLFDELVNRVPDITHLAKTDTPTSVSKSQSTFEKYCIDLFPIGRRFVNYKQLDEYVTFFLKSWNIQRQRHGNCFQCFYSTRKTKHKLSLFTDDGTPRRTKKSLKECIKCPFVIRFSIPGVKNKDKPPIFYEVKITQVNAKHSCGLSTMSFRAANRMSTSAKKFNLEALKVIVQCIRINPSLPALQLRPLLASCLPMNTALSSSFLSNFRRRCHLFIASNEDADELDSTSGSSLISPNRLSEEELTVLDQPIIRNNYRRLYANVMQNGSSTWKALDYLNKLKQKETGFDFRMRFNEESLPIGIIWITHTMRKHVLQFGDILFLDAQKRQYNKICWPYIGPVIKTGENKTRVIAESVVLSEDLDSYEWIINSISEMEPKWNIKNIKLIFADGLITDSLLERLGISDSCILRGDYWHLMHEVFPKEHNFGVKVFSMIGNHLRKMLTCESQDEWDIAYNQALSLITNYPQQKDKLQDIYNRPSYYAGYICRRICGNLKLISSVPAEQNHSSITRHLGDSAMWSITEQIKNLMERQMYFLNIDEKHQDENYLRQQNYTSDHTGVLRSMDVLAKKSLSEFGFKECWRRPLRISRSFQTKVDVDTNSNLVWKIGEEYNDSLSFNIKIAGKCSCVFRISYDCPCEHELAIESKFDVTEYAMRWLSPSVFREKYSDLLPSVNVVHDTNYTTPSFVNLTDVQDDKIIEESNIIKLSHDNELPQHRSDIDNNLLTLRGNKMIFNDLTKATSELVRAVINSKTQSANVLHNVREWTNKIRLKHNFIISFIDKDINTDNGVESGDTPISPLPAVGICGSISSTKKRKLSQREIQRPEAVSKETANRRATIDNFAVPKVRNYSKSCALCHDRGHNRIKCNRIANEFGAYPLPIHDTTLRNSFVVKLTTTTTNSSPLYPRQADDTRAIFQQLPNKMKALVVHKRYFINLNIVLINANNNICIECTCVKENYEINDTERLILVEPTAVMKFALIKSNLVVSLL